MLLGGGGGGDLSFDLEKACGRYKTELFNDLLSTFLSFENFENKIKCTL